ncbi:tryptophan 7-halogenase [Paractinoplanes rhizophilus]|uniref:Tryptophan 7-halogenase n=1 Tax=Paractinoplanes rhizophilus TaxID=1416877 RepID=A0ABW2HZD0_9ACTN|nr:tryptophan 7-halogenase [Actinoplanes sp.]
MKPDRVVVLGCGPAGAAAAITLAARGISPVVVDPRPPVEWQPGEGLPSAANALLRKLGVWPAFQSGGHLAGGGFLSCWGSDEPAFRPALLDPRGPSWQLDRPAFNRMLIAAAGAPRAHRITEVRRDGRQWIAGPLVADFLIDATGRSSALARLLGVPRRVHSRLVGMVALLPDPSPASAASIVEATPDGWWYASRVPGDRLVTALFTDAASARDISPGRWAALLRSTAQAGARAGDFDPPVGIKTVAAGSSALTRCAGPGWVAVGDAACAHDPLSARGLHDALSGGIAAAEAVALGDPAAIDAYARRVAAEYRAYLDDLAWFYRQEKRFPDSAFWRARSGQV